MHKVKRCFIDNDTCQNPYRMAYQSEWPHISPRAKGPEGWYGAQGLIYHAIWILACVLFYLSYTIKWQIKTQFWSIWLQTCLSWKDNRVHFFIVTSLICIFCMRADSDVANIMRCKFCIITTKYMINFLITYLPLYPVDIIHRIILSYSIVGIPTFCACILIVTSKINVNYT
jgi:hypothetical protein